MLTTLAAVRTYLGLAEDDTGDDALLGTFITAASDFVQGPTGAGRLFEAADNTMRTLDADAAADGRVLYLDCDLCQLDSITMDGTSVTLGDVVPLPRNEKPWYALRHKTDVWAGDIIISGRWAYSVEPPAIIVQATTRLVAWLYRQKDQAIDADRALRGSDGVIILPSSLPSDVRQIVGSFRSKL